MAFTARTGSCSMMLKSAAAAPVGHRRPCSQFWNVLTLTPIKCANSDCERLVRSRMTLTPEERISVRRKGFRWPRSPGFANTAQQFFKHLSFHWPNSSLTTLASCETCFGVRSAVALFGYNGNANFASPTAALDESAEIRIRGSQLHSSHYPPMADRNQMLPRKA